jgi:nicotinamide N-methyltransferase
MSSRPSSRMSAARSASGRSRRSSDVVKDGSVNSGSRLRSVGMESTLAENCDETPVHGKTDRDTDTIAEDETPSSPAKKKRFSATQGARRYDGPSTRVSVRGATELRKKYCRFSRRCVEVLGLLMTLEVN